MLPNATRPDAKVRRFPERGAACSTRKRKEAPVSATISREELAPDLRSDRFTIENIRRRLSSLGSDTWEGYFSVHQSITVRIKKQAGLKS